MRLYIRKLLREGLNEIDFDKNFPDVKGRCLTIDQVSEDLNAELRRLRDAKSDDKEVRKATPSRGKKAQIHPIHFKANKERLTKGGKGLEIDIGQYIKAITSKPKLLIDQNKKMEKSDSSGHQITVNTGVPALAAIVYDKDKQQFYGLNTCPGAGACIEFCYARGGQYGMNDGNILKLLQRVNLLMNDPEEYYHMLMDELEPLAVGTRRKGRREGIDKQLVIRWNDAGDFFSQKYLDIAKRVTDDLLASGYNVKSYAYTKQAKFYDMGEEKFVMNFSTGAHPNQTKQLDLDKTKYSDVVPADLMDKKRKEVTSNVFSDLFVKSDSGRGYEIGLDGLPIFVKGGADELKRRISKHYNVPIDTLVYQNELPTQEGEKFQYNAIVLPKNDSDISAQRWDVQRTFLLFHR
jgi:hypothetical protein